MKSLEERILNEAKFIDNKIVKVDGFLNHRLDCNFLVEIGKEFGKFFDFEACDVILTSEASGIAIATAAGIVHNKPVIFAKKAKSDNIKDDFYKYEIHSFTYNKDVTLILSKEWLAKGSKVILLDDFIANGEAVKGLVNIAEQAECEILGVGIVVEKGFQKGGKEIREKGYNVKSLAIIDAIVDNKPVFREND